MRPLTCSLRDQLMVRIKVIFYNRLIVPTFIMKVLFERIKYIKSNDQGNLI